MTRRWLAAAAAFAMMSGFALAQGVSSGSSTSTQPTTTSTVRPLGNNSAGIAAPSTPLSPPAVGRAERANPNITNYGSGGMQRPPGSPAQIGTGTQ
jgi:hypothetical protein